MRIYISPRMYPNISGDILFYNIRTINYVSTGKGGNRVLQTSLPGGMIGLPYDSSTSREASVNDRLDSSTPRISRSCDILEGI